MFIKKTERPSLFSVAKIWDQSPHCALTDLIRFNDSWYCSFRESDRHVYGKDGIIRIITSQDGLVWATAATFKEEGTDLRDPKLSITPDGMLMLLVGGTIYDGRRYVSRQPRVAFSEDAKQWSPFSLVLEPHEWLWRVTWFQGKAYGVSYRFSNPYDPSDEWLVKLFESQDGIEYNQIAQWDIPGYPNEATLRFLKSGEMIALLRRDHRHQNNALIGTSEPPYTHWNWTPTQHHLGGPNFIMAPNGSMLAGGRFLFKNPWGMFEKTALATMTLEDIRPVLLLPSGGDTSYPGMVFYDGLLWMSYYSSHEGKTSIYLAKIQVPMKDNAV